MNKNITDLLFNILEYSGDGLEAELCDADKMVINEIFDAARDALQLILPTEQFNKITYVTPYLVESDE